MGNSFLELRCPNRPVKGNQKECRAMLGGISELVLQHWPFKTVPFEDLRYCKSCGGFFEVTLKSRTGGPSYKILPKGISLPLFSELPGAQVASVVGVRTKP